MMRHLLLLLVICGAYEYVQGFICNGRDFRLHPEQDKASNGCSADICKEDVFRPHDCTSLQRDARCSEEDLKYPNRKEACDCCHLPPRITMPPPMMPNMLP
ncbi:uncharacterized protein LOC128192376 isoform X1 [Crassostrea angulata]|uniref:uncharacterized protein LOC128192376 isoform X1 n=2 Tax=Magallana angulata TaxID=2784310 RepID=UPI0022B216EA|nr:uncharacterized protein LOC128192376 isoform X1 [Crassostrea angulata]